MRISFTFSRDISGLSVGNHTVEVRVMTDVNQEALCSQNFYKPPSCADECSPSGKRECTDGTHYRICGDYDADDCLEWSSTYSCGGGTPTCFNGYCRCQDQCPYETKRECQSPGVSDNWHRCGDYDADECVEWKSGWASCGPNTVCYNTSGACVNCECKSGYVECSETCDTAECVAECAPSKCDSNPCDACQDLCEPEVSLNAPPNNQWINYDPTFKVNITYPAGGQVIAYFEITQTADGGGSWAGWGNWTAAGGISQYGPLGLLDGQYSWRSYARDGGKTGDWGGPWITKIDRVNPDALITYEDGIINTQNVNLTRTESDDRSDVQTGWVEERHRPAEGVCGVAKLLLL